jgi:hypothetical protein
LKVSSIEQAGDVHGPSELDWRSASWESSVATRLSTVPEVQVDWPWTVKPPPSMSARSGTAVSELAPE